MGAHARLSVHGREDSFNEGRVLQLTFFWSVGCGSADHWPS